MPSSCQIRIMKGIIRVVHSNKEFITSYKRGQERSPCCGQLKRGGGWRDPSKDAAVSDSFSVMEQPCKKGARVSALERRNNRGRFVKALAGEFKIKGSCCVERAWPSCKVDCGGTGRAAVCNERGVSCCLRSEFGRIRPRKVALKCWHSNLKKIRRHSNFSMRK